MTGKENNNDTDVPSEVAVPGEQSGCLVGYMNTIDGILGQINDTCDPSAIIGPSADNAWRDKDEEDPTAPATEEKTTAETKKVTLQGETMPTTSSKKSTKPFKKKFSLTKKRRNEEQPNPESRSVSNSKKSTKGESTSVDEGREESSQVSRGLNKRTAAEKPAPEPEIIHVEDLYEPSPYSDVIKRAATMTSDMEKLRNELEGMRTENFILLDQLNVMETTANELLALSDD